MVRLQVRRQSVTDDMDVGAFENDEATVVQDRERAADSKERVPIAARAVIERQIAGRRSGARIVEEKDRTKVKASQQPIGLER